MVKKVKKINSHENKAKPVKENGFRLGRNLGTFLIVITGLVLLFFAIFVPYSYISTYQSNKVNPFSEDSYYKSYVEKYDAQSNKGTSTAPKDDFFYEEVKRVKAKDFKKFDVNLQIDGKWRDPAKDEEDTGKVMLRLEVKWNEETSKLTTDHSLNPLDSSKNVYAKVALASDWIGYEKVSTSGSSMQVTRDKSGINKYRFDSLPKFPISAPTWPVPISVERPNAYVYLEYSYSQDIKVDGAIKGKKKIREAYIIEFTPDEYFK